jgi:hypothetical protein
MLSTYESIKLGAPLGLTMRPQNDGLFDILQGEMVRQIEQVVPCRKSPVTVGLGYLARKPSLEE